MVLFEKNNKSH